MPWPRRTAQPHCRTTSRHSQAVANGVPAGGRPRSGRRGVSTPPRGQGGHLRPRHPHGRTVGGHVHGADRPVDRSLAHAPRYAGSGPLRRPGRRASPPAPQHPQHPRRRSRPEPAGVRQPGGDRVSPRSAPAARERLGQTRCGRSAGGRNARPRRGGGCWWSRTTRPSPRSGRGRSPTRATRCGRGTPRGAWRRCCGTGARTRCCSTWGCRTAPGACLLADLKADPATAGSRWWSSRGPEALPPAYRAWRRPVLPKPFDLERALAVVAARWPPPPAPPRRVIAWGPERPETGRHPRRAPARGQLPVPRQPVTDVELGAAQIATGSCRAPPALPSAGGAGVAKGRRGRAGARCRATHLGPPVADPGARAGSGTAGAGGPVRRERRGAGRPGAAAGTAVRWTRSKQRRPERAGSAQAARRQRLARLAAAVARHHTAGYRSHADGPRAAAGAGAARPLDAAEAPPGGAPAVGERGAAAGGRRALGGVRSPGRRGASAQVSPSGRGVPRRPRVPETSERRRAVAGDGPGRPQRARRPATGVGCGAGAGAPAPRASRRRRGRGPRA